VKVPSFPDSRVPTFPGNKMSQSKTRIQNIFSSTINLRVMRH
jgi:hypothetical protein